MNFIKTIRIKIASRIKEPYVPIYKPSCVCPINESKSTGDTDSKPMCQCKNICPIYKEWQQKTK